jgi:hypothetical protein
MRLQAEMFIEAANPTLHHRTHEEILNDGFYLDVQVKRGKPQRSCLSVCTRRREPRFMRTAFDTGRTNQ